MENKNNTTIEPYTIGKCAVILIALTLLDTVGCIVLLVGSYIFLKKGHTGLAIALCIANFVTPDPLPFVDEILQVVKVINAVNKAKEYVQDKQQEAIEVSSDN